MKPETQQAARNSRARPEQAAGLAAPLPFYPGCTLETCATGTGLALRWRDSLHVLDWTNETFTWLNAEGALHLTRRTVGAYAKFYFAHVRGHVHGCFWIVEPDDPIPWQPWANASDKEAVRNQLAPLTYTGIDDEGLHCLYGTVIFSTYDICVLFRCVVRVAPRPMPVYDPEQDCMAEFFCGQLTLCDEEILLECIAVIPPARPPDWMDEQNAIPDYWSFSDP